MDLTKVLAQLRLEMDHLDSAIASLERLQAKEARRGRPPKLLAEIRRAALTPTRQVRRKQRADRRSM